MPTVYPASDHSQLFGILSGGVRGVVGDTADPQLRMLVRVAADALLNKDDTAADEVSRGGMFGCVCLGGSIITPPTGCA